MSYRGAFLNGHSNKWLTTVTIDSRIASKILNLTFTLKNTLKKRIASEEASQWQGPNLMCCVLFFYNSEPLKFPNGFGKGIFATWLIEG